MGHLYPKSLKGRKLNLLCSGMRKWKRRGFKGESRKICLCCIQYIKKKHGENKLGQQENYAQMFGNAMTWMHKPTLRSWPEIDPVKIQERRTVLQLTFHCLTHSMWILPSKFSAFNMIIYFSVYQPKTYMNPEEKTWHTRLKRSIFFYRKWLTMFQPCLEGCK